jgi:hypothetical protein
MQITIQPDRDNDQLYLALSSRALEAGAVAQTVKRGFPRPIVELATGGIWLRSQVDAYAAAKGRTGNARRRARGRGRARQVGRPEGEEGYTFTRQERVAAAAASS